MQPKPAHVPKWAIGQNSRVLDGYAELIIESVGHPGPKRVPIESARVHQNMKRVFVMISRDPHFAQIGGEGLTIPWRFGHSTNSNPSEPMVMPAASTAARSGVPGLRIGLVLLIWI